MKAVQQEMKVDTGIDLLDRKDLALKDLLAKRLIQTLILNNITRKILNSI
jgi:hypothetical protein